ncbi:MAG: hypothetical protein KAH17_05180 [Bacteroidales bacterium]|nr:hypothetical protein [Bacteroidales bacterium]
MIINELPLLGFTLLMQVSVGLTVLFNAFIFWPAFNTRGKISNSLFVIPLIALGFGLLAAFLSFLHIGEPIDIIKSKSIELSHLRFEILSVIIYLIVLGAFLIFTITTKSSWRRIQKILLDLSSLAGLAGLFAMSGFSIQEPYPIWNTLYTPLYFFGTTFLLGSIILLLMISKTGSLSSQRALAGMSALFVVYMLILIPLMINNLENLNIVKEESLSILFSDLLWIFYGRILLLLITLGTLFRSLFVIRSSMTKCSILIWPLSIALIAAFFAELGGRILFFNIVNTISGL